MRVSITIHPNYNFLRSYIEQIPLTFESLPNVLYQDRNVVKTDEVSNLKLVIKSYGRIYLTNRIRYSWFSPSKAERAYQNGLRLLDEGFLTPAPIAFIECFKGGLLTKSYFISLHSDFAPLTSVMADQQDFLIRDLVGFAHQLHRHGIYHMDFSGGNILCRKEGDHFQFALVDNNRMEFGKFDYSLGLKTFLRLGLNRMRLSRVAKEYARLGKGNEKRTIKEIFNIDWRHQQLDRLRKQAKKMVIDAGHRLVSTGHNIFARYGLPITYYLLID